MSDAMHFYNNKQMLASLFSGSNAPFLFSHIFISLTRIMLLKTIEKGAMGNRYTRCPMNPEITGFS